MELRVSPGQTHDVTQADNLLAEHCPHYLIADQAYDSDTLRQQVRARGSISVIPSSPGRVASGDRAGRTVRRRLLRHQYRRRNLVERFVNRLKHFRRIATRYEKTARNFLGFIHLASTLFWLQSNLNVNTT